jgi:hypothetical protein
MYLPKIIGRWVVVFCFATNLAVGAAPESRLQTAESVEQQLEQEFKQCVAAVIAVKPEGNQLISAGFASCHQQMAQYWLEHHDHARAVINQRFVSQPVGNQCAAMVLAIDTQVDAYAQQVDGLEVLGLMPLDANYDVAHLIAKHRYNLFYYLATSPGGCG